LASLVDLTKAEGAGFGAEQEMERHVIVSGDVIHRICCLAPSLSRVYTIVNDDFARPGMESRKSNPVTVEWETRAKNLLKAELKRKGVTYAQLAEKLSDLGISETERNLNNKI